MSKDDLSRSQQEWEEEFEFLPAVQYIEKGDETMYRGELYQRVNKHNREIENIKQDIRKIRLQQELMHILNELRPRYHIPYQTNVQKAKTLNETEREARYVIDFQTTTFTFKFFYILSIVIFGFFLQCFWYKATHLSTLFISSFLIGLFPIKNVMYLPRPTKNICDTCERIESFIWKKELSNEDIIEMNKLINYGNQLFTYSAHSKLLNAIFFFVVLYVSTTNNIIPYTSFSSKTPTLFHFLFKYSGDFLVFPVIVFFAMFLLAFYTFFLKFFCFRWIIQYQFYPEIMFLFY